MEEDADQLKLTDKLLQAVLAEAQLVCIGQPSPIADSTSPGQRPLSVLPVVYRLWASIGLGHLREVGLGVVAEVGF